MTSNSAGGAPSTPKIERVMDEHGLVDMGERLEERWLGTGETDQYSTRQLADYVNKEILRSAIDASDTFTLSGDVEEVYSALTDDEDTGATLVKSRLEQSGIDVEAVTDDFISHQTVHRYLKRNRGVERPQQSPEEKLESAAETIQQLRGRTTAVTEQKIRDLENSGAISVGDFSVLNDIQIICERCGRSHDAPSFFEQGGCDCSAE
ncbi:hypothetical protein G9C85_15035 [Halorubellus sp. JP-L1]|uniref:rod-determining factor RdfA n=1 Tax=Halorubellus sp. JP-L1 TaxID=2715753 RepID=UPI001407699F|nr:rod-determining factor RdfA [Halorubellus sp. JP-L1]NHN42933.1 hypothetical protein [Halorubellus sp. JP-L1]